MENSYWIKDAFKLIAASLQFDRLIAYDFRRAFAMNMKSLVSVVR